MSLSLACFIGLATISEDHEGPGWKRFNIFLAVTLLVIILTVPVILFRIISKNHRQLGDETFLIKYNTLYDCLNYDKNKTSLYYIPLLFTKRFALAFSIVLLRQNLPIQLLLCLNVTLTALVYYLWVRPFSTLYLNRIELMNEGTFLMALWFCFVFTDFVEDTETKSRLGWAFIFLVLLNLGVNFFGIFYQIFTVLRKVYQRLKNLYYRIQDTVGQVRTVKLQPTSDVFQDGEGPIVTFDSQTGNLIILQHTHNSLASSRTSTSSKQFCLACEVQMQKQKKEAQFVDISIIEEESIEDENLNNTTVTPINQQKLQLKQFEITTISTTPETVGAGVSPKKSQKKVVSHPPR